MSSSTLMSNHLETDSAELKSYISKFFADKANEFTAQMKTHMDSLVEKKITNYYEAFNSEPFEDFQIGYQMSGCIDSHQFKISINTYTHIFQRNVQYSNAPIISPPIKHSLTIPMLHCIKSIFTRGISCPSEGIRNIIENMLQNPKYFMTNCTEFEETCRKEYELIKEQKQELGRLIKEQVENVEYYSDLEKKIEEVETKEWFIQQERQKIKEERSRLFAVKQKLDLMKQELNNERDAFEKEKRSQEIKNIDLDDYFELPVSEIVSPTIAESILFRSHPSV